MTDDEHDLAHQVLTFWFDRAPKEWFSADPALDVEISELFYDAHDRASQGRLDGLKETPEGCLALALLLDQFPRNIFRGTPAAFASDAQARAVAAHAVAQGFDRGLSPEQRLFLYLPFEHSEDPADQERAVALITPLGNAEWTDYAIRHRDIIARFGRFPHRNAILGRKSTPEEEAFLREPGSSF